MINYSFKKSLVFTIILLFIGISFSQSYGVMINEIAGISQNQSNILFVGGSGSDNYTKIQDAIDAAKPDDIILVSRGVYYENLYIDKKIILFGEDKDSTIIDGGRTVQESIVIENNRNSDVVFVFSADSVYIADFSIRNGGAGINFENSTNNNIAECNIYSNSIGFKLNESSYNLILCCNLFKNLIDGIQMIDSFNNNLRNLNIFLNEEGVLLEYSSYNIFNCCNISNNIYKNMWLKNYSNNNETLKFDFMETQPTKGNTPMSLRRSAPYSS